MSSRIRTAWSRPALATASLATAAALLAPAALDAQAPGEAPALELTLGGVMAFYEDHFNCPPDGFLDAIQGSVKLHMDSDRSVSAFAIEATLALDGMFPWPWAEDLTVPLDHDGGIRITGNVFFDLVQADRLGLDLVAGAGLRRWGEGDGTADFDIDVPRGLAYRVQSQSDPIVLYGVLADVAVSDRLSLQASARGNTTFTGDLEVASPTGQISSLDVGTQTFVQVTLGVGVRLGS